MADSEKLTALKKAYAEIILNTAKEAAARIMVSEKKALRYQQELSVAKDEALCMLLRLKKMLDAKVNEAEMMALNYQKRIEELEAQLGEAEDIVRDLRAELRETQDELEKLTKEPMQCLGEQNLKHDVVASAEISEENTINNFESIRSSPPEAQTEFLTVFDVKSSFLSGKNVGNKCSCKDNCYVCNADFACIMLRRKEPDLYRNGCTQRIRALDRCLWNGNISLSEKVDVKKNENTGEVEEGKDMHPNLSPRADMCKPEEKTDEQVLPLSYFCRKMKRDARYKIYNAPLSIVIPDQVIATCQESDLLCPESFSHVTDENAQFSEDPRIINHDTQNGPHSPSIPSSPSDAAKVVIESGYEEVDKDGAKFGNACDLQNDTNNDKILTDKIELTRQDSRSSESLGVASCKTDLAVGDVSMVNSDVKFSEITEGSSTRAVNNKFLMYMFKRKRKKDSWSSPDRDCSLDDDTS